MTGELPVTTSGHPSYSLAKSRVRMQLDEVVYAAMAEYGLTCLEMADILADRTLDCVREAVRQQQRRRAARKGVIGTPRVDD